MWLALALTDEGWMETVTGSACPSSRTVNLRPPPPPPLPPLPSFLGASATITCEKSARHTGLQPRSHGHGVAASITRTWGCSLDHKDMGLQPRSPAGRVPRTGVT